MTEFTARASSWGGLFDCAYRWEGEHMLGLRRPSSLRATLGTAVHAGTAAFDTGRITGKAITIDEAAGVFVDVLMHPSDEVDYSNDDLTVKEAELIGLKLTTRYCAEISPAYDYLAVERKLSPFSIDCGGNVVVKLTGSMDRARVCMTSEGVIISDMKTGSRVIEKGIAVTKGRAPQLGTYQLMYENETGDRTVGSQIVALKTNTKAEIAVSRVFDARRIMVGTEEFPGLLQYAAEMFRSGLFPPNPQSVLCSNKYCSRWDTCPYHQ